MTYCQKLLRRLLGALLVGVFVPTAPLTAQAVSEEALAQSTAVPVRFRGETLFEINAPIGTLQPLERARAIETRLAAIAAGASDVLDAIAVVERDQSSDVVAGEQLVLSVTDRDGAPLGRTRQQLAADDAQRLQRALRAEFSGRSLKGISLGIVMTLLATLALIVAWRLLRRAIERAVSEVQSWESRRIRGIKVKGVEIMSAARMTNTATQSLGLLRWVLVALAIVIYLETVLALFPWTRAAAIQFREFVFTALSTTTLAVVNYLPNIAYLALIVVVLRFVLRVSGALFDALGTGALRLGRFHPEWAAPSAKIVRFAVLVLGVLVAFPYLPGAESPAFRGVSIFLGVLLSLGSSSAVSNVIAGIVMTYMMPFRMGDRVKIGETVGDIVEANMLVVRVRTIKNVEITIPNAAVLSGHILNYSAKARDGGLILHSTVTIGYDVPWRQVHELLIGAAQKTTDIVAEPTPFVLQTSLDDFYVSYQINAYTHQANRMAVIYGELHQHIQDAFAVAGVEIMSPHYRAMRDGNMVTLPSDQLPADYSAPAFRVATVPEATT